MLLIEDCYAIMATPFYYRMSNEIIFTGFYWLIDYLLTSFQRQRKMAQMYLKFIERIEEYMLNNLSNATNAVIKVVGYKELEDFVIQVVGMETPTFSIPIVDVPSGPRGHGRAKISGTTLDHEQIQIRILIDKELESYLAIYKWMLRVSNYLKMHNTAHIKGESPTAIQIHVLDNIKKNIMITFNMVDAFPINLSSLEYKYDEEGDVAVMCNVAFDCKRVEIEKDGKVITA